MRQAPHQEGSVTGGRPSSRSASLAAMLAALFLVIFLLGLLLRQWPPAAGPGRAVIDALLLAVVVTPLLYFFIDRTLVGSMAGRQRAEEALRLSQERFRDLFENTSDLIQSIAPDGRFLYVNPAWHRTLGYGAEEVGRLTIFDILAPECLVHCQAAIGEVLAGRAVDKVEAVFIARDGRRVFVEGNASAKVQDGRPAYTRAIFHDITARKEAEAERERLIAELRESLAQVKTLSGLLPICAWCKKIRDDKGYWSQLESYLSKHSGVDFSHGICPECLRKHYAKLVDGKEKKDQP